MNQWKSAHAVKTDARTLADAMEGADVFFGLSAKGAVTRTWSARWPPKPIIFAMANPDPEITPEEVAEVRDDAIMATGRSDYPNQVNNVLGFPYIFRGALDVRATTINDGDEDRRRPGARRAGPRGRARRGRRRLSGRAAEVRPDYIIPVPFDPRLISHVPPAVAKAAMDTGVARKPIVDMEAYKQQLSARRDPIAGTLQRIFERVRARPSASSSPRARRSR
jgi:malate dehydrogenase (oxaloacetate-decarboxylating)(NADP+)